MSSSHSYMTREQLSELIKSSPDSVAIIDVRDEDYIGGHIVGSCNVPSSTLDYKIPELARTLQDKPKVVFHCALSQQRGPAAARRYLGERERLLQKGKSAGEESNKEQDSSSTKPQEVYVLHGGFTRWQEIYGQDEALTEDYAPDLWQF